MEFNVADCFEAAADAVPEREALVAGAARRRYAELDRRATRLAHHLAGAGVRAGEHVGLYATNGAEYVEAMLACYKIRAVPVNVNYRYVEAELRYLFENADLVAAVLQRRFGPRVEAVRAELPALRHLVVLEDGSGEALPEGAALYEAALAEAPEARDFAPRSADDRYVLYTGGTTGLPKGVVWRHEDVIFALGGGIDHATGVRAERPEDLAAKAEAGPPLTMMVLPPLMHGAAQWAVLGALFTGGRIVLYTGRSFDAGEVWRIVAEEGVQVLTLTGDAMARPLVDALPAAMEALDLSGLAAVASSAAVFSPAVKAELQRLLPKLVLTDSIGASESGFNGTALTAPGASDSSEAGVRVRPGADTCVVDEALRPLPPGSGRVGRLARGGNVPLGYYKDPEKSRETFVEIEGRRHAVPGDLARVEADGSITLLGRGSVCINTGGEKVHPEEVEAALKAHPEVFDAVVVGVPDPRWGERVAAVVAPRPGCRPELEALAARCREQLAGYKLPRALRLVERIERHPSGKPDYRWAKRLWEEDAPAGAGGPEAEREPWIST